MDCDQIWFHAQAHHQGHLTWWRSLLISQHLEDCPDCQGTYNRQIGYRSVISAKCQEQAPDDLANRIFRAIAAPINPDADHPW